MRPDVRARGRIGRAPQSRARRRGSLGTSDEAPGTRGTTIDREGRIGREEHDSHNHSLEQVGGPGWDRPRCAVNDALPQWDAGPRGTAPGSERLARRSGTPFADTVNAPPPPRVGLWGQLRREAVASAYARAAAECVLQATMVSDQDATRVQVGRPYRALTRQAPTRARAP